jgi:sec-independent protein translocase protein TatA
MSFKLSRQKLPRPEGVATETSRQFEMHPVKEISATFLKCTPVFDLFLFPPINPIFTPLTLIIMETIFLFGMPSGMEWFIIGLFVLVFFGAKKIPEFAKGLGKGIREFKDAVKDVKKEVDDAGKEVPKIDEK